ncbi:MAG: hypothetical protein RBQ95_03395 [Paracholeplasma sp.]|nr:hypothetical protein [Paracholeplasma sp.]MDY3195880.1 hypothetical protein [Paracholeplasma sp.]
MSFFDRYINSKLYHYTDIFFKMILLNVLMITTTILGLVVFGLPLSLLVGSISLRIILKKTSVNVFEVYFKTLKSVVKKTIKPVVVFSFILMILGFNSVYFYFGLEPFDWFYFISFSLMVFLFVFSLVSYIHGLFLSVLYDLNVKSLLKHSYLLTIGFIVRSLLLLLIGFVYTYTLILIPILGIIIGLSGFSLLILVTLVSGYKRIQTLDEALDEEVKKILESA